MIRCESMAENITLSVKENVLNGMGDSPRKPNPPDLSGWVGIILSPTFETIRINLNQIIQRQIQRKSKNWKMGKLINAAQYPAQESWLEKSENGKIQVLSSMELTE